MPQVTREFQLENQKKCLLFSKILKTETEPIRQGDDEPEDWLQVQRRAVVGR